MIKTSQRLESVRRIFDPYSDRSNYVRLDRNEDPVGWDEKHFKAVLNTLTPHTIAAYPEPKSFYEKLSKWLQINGEQIYVTMGSDAAVKNVFEAYVEKGDYVLMLNPTWRMYEVYLNIYQGVGLYVDYDYELTLDYKKLIESIKKFSVKLVVIANPNQPTGTVIPLKVVTEILRVARECNTLVLVDEAYYLFSDVTSINLLKDFTNLIIVRTFSKAFGLASLRLGYCVSVEEVIKNLKLLRPVTDSNGIALKFGEYVLDNMNWMKERISDFVRGREYLKDTLRNLDLKTFDSMGNFLLIRYPDILTAQTIIDNIREKGYLIKGPFTNKPLENCVRISIGPEKLMIKFIQDCESILAGQEPKPVL